MKNLHLDPGALRHRVALYENQTVEDGCGGFEDNWQQIAEVWARIEQARAINSVRADSEEPEITHSIYLRQPLQLKAGMRLAHASTLRKFEILTVRDADETARYWRCECRLEADL